MSETKKSKDLHLIFPESLWQGVKKFAKSSGCSYTNVIYQAVFFFLFSRGLIDYEKPIVKIEPKRVPESIKFCDGDRCEV